MRIPAPIPKLKNVFSLTDGIFTRLKDVEDIPWGDDADLASQLDLIYIGNHSGNKYVSPLLAVDEDDLTTQYKDDVVTASFAMEGDIIIIIEEIIPTQALLPSTSSMLRQALYHHQ